IWFGRSLCLLQVIFRLPGCIRPAGKLDEGEVRLSKTNWLAAAWLKTITFCFLLSALAVPASAQITTGNITGTVKDAQGGVIPGATVTLIDEAKGTKLAPATT